MFDLRFHMPQVDWTWAVRAALAHFGLGFLAVLLVVWLFVLVNRPTWFKRDFSGLLRSAFWGGVFGNLSDLDHVSMFFGRENGRALHTPLAYIGGMFIALFLVFLVGKSKRGCDRQGCPECVADVALDAWRRRLGFGALMSVSVIAHVLEDYYIGAF